MLRRSRPLTCGKRINKSALLSMSLIADLEKEVYAVHRVAGTFFGVFR